MNREERDNQIRALRGRMLPHELAVKFSLSRQQIHNILRRQDRKQLLLDRMVYHENKASAIATEIRAIRGDTPPPCFGQNDCSTSVLATCPWRMDCGKD